MCYYPRINRKLASCFNSIFSPDYNKDVSLQNICQSICACPQINQAFLSNVEVGDSHIQKYLNDKYSSNALINKYLKHKKIKNAQILTKAKRILEKQIKHKGDTPKFLSSLPIKFDADQTMPTNTNDLQQDQDQEAFLYSLIDGLIKGKYNLLTK
jgi:hypothetical protein